MKDGEREGGRKAGRKKIGRKEGKRKEGRKEISKEGFSNPIDGMDTNLTINLLLLLLFF